MLSEFIPYEKIIKIKPVIAQRVNGKRESMAQVKKRVGCTLIVNGGTYTTGYVPDSGLKIDGRDYSRSEYYGLGSNDEKHFEFSYAGKWTRDYIGAHKDYIRDEMFSPVLKDIAKRGRTGVGCTENGIQIVSISDSEKLRCTSTEFMLTHFKGCTHAINLDGGGSSQWDSPFGRSISGRPVLWYLCVWLNPITVEYTVAKIRTWLAVRNRPSVMYKNLGRLYSGESVHVLAWTGKYAKIVHGDAEAYVTGRYLNRI